MLHKILGGLCWFKYPICYKTSEKMHQSHQYFQLLYHPLLLLSVLVIPLAINWYLPFETVSAGDHCDLRMSRQILPLLLILGWYIFVVNATCVKTWDMKAVNNHLCSTSINELIMPNWSVRPMKQLLLLVVWRDNLLESEWWGKRLHSGMDCHSSGIETETKSIIALHILAESWKQRYLLDPLLLPANETLFRKKMIYIRYSDIKFKIHNRKHLFCATRNM